MIAVTRTIDGSLGIMSLRVSDVVFLEYDRKIDRVLVHTANDMFYSTGTLKYWMTAFNDSGYSFQQVDRNNVVNLGRITCLDPVFKLAYFEDNITPESKSCTIAWARYRQLEESLDLIKPNLAIN